MRSIDDATKATITNALAVTTPRSREVLAAYFSSATATEAAKRLGISRRTLSQQLRRFELVTGLSAAELAPTVRESLAKAV
jgi:DNA-binding CsgD family transcriptional regulator